MTKVIGQIESLKKIRMELNQNGITRFNSIGEIHDFLANYENELENVYHETKLSVIHEMENLQTKLLSYQNQYELLKKRSIDELNSNIFSLNERIEILESSSSKSFFRKILNWGKLRKLRSSKNNLESNFSRIIQTRTNTIKRKVNETSFRFDDLSQNMDRVVSKRCSTPIARLHRTKSIVERLNPLIFGAIGESMVVRELTKLSDSFILLNDFSVKFNPPIYNRKENDRIFSIQIDHLLVANSGIFILETKNWSKKSIKSFNLRSPVEQIKRTSYALFVFLNSESDYNYLNLSNHHWGLKQIPIRNVVVMINEKPKEQFKFVKIKSLSELNEYITYFDPIFTDSDVRRISNYLRKIMN